MVYFVFQLNTQHTHTRDTKKRGPGGSCGYIVFLRSDCFSYQIQLRGIIGGAGSLGTSSLAIFSLLRCLEGGVAIKIHHNNKGSSALGVLIPGSSTFDTLSPTECTSIAVFGHVESAHWILCYLFQKLKEGFSFSHCTKSAGFVKNVSASPCARTNSMKTSSSPAHCGRVPRPHLVSTPPFVFPCAVRHKTKRRVEVWYSLPVLGPRAQRQRVVPTDRRSFVVCQ